MKDDAIAHLCVQIMTSSVSLQELKGNNEQ